MWRKEESCDSTGRGRHWDLCFRVETHISICISLSDLLHLTSCRVVTSPHTSWNNTESLHLCVLKTAGLSTNTHRVLPVRQAPFLGPFCCFISFSPPTHHEGQISYLEVVLTFSPGSENVFPFPDEGRLKAQRVTQATRPGSVTGLTARAPAPSLLWRSSLSLNSTYPAYLPLCFQFWVDSMLQDLKH